MSDTARLALTVVCYVVAVLAQLAGLALLAKEGRRVGATLPRWRDADPQPGSAGRRGELDRVVDDLLGNRFDRTSALALLALGVVAGGLGHFLGL